MAADKPVVVIVGPTASGKTRVAISLAKKIRGEIICADSRTVYRHMNIGTAKPMPQEQQGVIHWGLDLTSPNERYNAAQFQAYARTKIQEIHARGNVPIVVGGTGLYVDALIFDYNFPTPPSEKQRSAFESMQTEELYLYCVKHNIELPEQNKNNRRLERATRTSTTSDQRSSPPKDTIIVVGIATNKQVIEQRIARRTEQMFDDGVVEEARMLGKKYGWNVEAMKSNVYRIIKTYLDGTIDLRAAKEKNTITDRQLVKRQMTWFRRNPHIVWVRDDEVEKNVIARLE